VNSIIASSIYIKALLMYTDPESIHHKDQHNYIEHWSLCSVNSENPWKSSLLSREQIIKALRTALRLLSIIY